MDSRDVSLAIQFWMLGFLIGVAASMTTVALTGKLPSQIHREAAEAGAGQYVTDPKTGETRFEWKGCE